MIPVERSIRSGGLFLRRRDLLALGYSDRQLRAALAARRVFRVRHGWYSVPSAPEAAVRAVRVGGRLTGVSALESYGLRVPRREQLHVAVPRRACRLRSPSDRRRRLGAPDGVRVHWLDPLAVPASSWRVSVDEALRVVIAEEPRDVAVACASAALHHRTTTLARLRAVFAASPARTRGWLGLVSAADESHGETFVRLWLRDAGIRCEQQPVVAGVGRLDFRLSPSVYVEVDGAQHDPAWTGDSVSSYESDHDRDARLATRHGRALRFTYRQLYQCWPDCLAAIETAVADDLAFIAWRMRDPRPPRALASLRTSRALRKRRNSSASSAQTGVSPPEG